MVERRKRGSQIAVGAGIGAGVSGSIFGGAIVHLIGVFTKRVFEIELGPADLTALNIIVTAPCAALGAIVGAYMKMWQQKIDYESMLMAQKEKILDQKELEKELINEIEKS